MGRSVVLHGPERKAVGYCPPAGFDFVLEASCLVLPNLDSNWRFDTLDLKRWIESPSGWCMSPKNRTEVRDFNHRFGRFLHEAVDAEKFITAVRDALNCV